MSGGGAQQGQAGGMGGGFGMNNQQPMPQQATGGGFGMNNQQPMGGGMQQQLPPQMQPQMSALLQGGMQQPLAAMGGGMPLGGMPMRNDIQHRLASLSPPGMPLGGMPIQGRQMPPPGYVNDLAYLNGMVGMPAQNLSPMEQYQQQLNQIRQQTQNGMMPQGDIFIPQGNSQGQSFGDMLSSLSPEFRAGLLNPRPPVGALPNPQYVDPNTGRYTGLALPIGLQPNPQTLPGQNLMGDINAGQPGIPSTQGGIGSLGPMRSTPTPARPLPPTPTRPEPARAVQTINRAEQQAKIQGAQDQMNRMRSMGVGGARDYLSQIMGRR
jgi:hypothetical protein